MAGGLFWTSTSGRLSAAEAFATLSIVALVSSPLQVLLNAFPQFTSVTSCFGRIQRYLLLDDQVDQRTLSGYLESELRTNLVPGSDPNAEHSLNSVELETFQSTDANSYKNTLVRFENASVAVSDRATPILKDLTLSINHASLTVVLGPVGSGKTTLLRTLLGETNIVEGSVHVEQDSVAYCDQTPWLRNISIRDNILGQTLFDSEWYHTVLNSCLLDEDMLQIPGGDIALVGSGGTNVSGGQRQRIVRLPHRFGTRFANLGLLYYVLQALARAIYSRKRFLVLDDIFSALDRRTGHAIFCNLFGVDGLLRKSRTTTVLATNLCK